MEIVRIQLPGEESSQSQQDYVRTRAADRNCVDCRFCRHPNSRITNGRCFIFKYSPRPGTNADELLADDVPEEVKRRRRVAVDEACSLTDDRSAQLLSLNEAL